MNFFGDEPSSFSNMVQENVFSSSPIYPQIPSSGGNYFQKKREKKEHLLNTNLNQVHIKKYILVCNMCFLIKSLRHKKIKTTRCKIIDRN